MKRTIFIVLAIITLAPGTLLGTPKAAYVWNQLEDGLYYATYSFTISEKERTTIHAFRIDPKKFKLDVLIAKNEETGTTTEELAKNNNALTVINGGFFTPEHKSIGLIVRNGKRISSLHNTSWWSIFALKNNRATIMRPNQFTLTKNTQIALQVGPRLVIDGKIPKLKESFATRSAVGISRKGLVTLVITSGHGISMNELAKRMRDSRWQGGLECPSAMALDGGSSSQIYAKIGKFEFSQQGSAKITNGLAVLAK